MRARQVSPGWIGVLWLLGAWGFDPVAQAAQALFVEAVCIDDGAVQDGLEGGMAAPHAACAYAVNRPAGFNRRVGSASADAQAIAGVRSVGVDILVDAELSTSLPTVFGGRAVAEARIDDTFIVTGNLPLGTPVGNGLMQINALAMGQIRLDTAGSVTVNTYALLHYGIAVGSESKSFSELVYIGDLQPGEIRAFNVPFLIPAVPFLGHVSIPVSMFARAQILAELDDDGSVDGRVQFGNSLHWLGLSNVTDASGTPLASFSAVSGDTGVDWGAFVAVPAPAAWLSMLSSAALLGVATRRRSRV
jgi:hypothetical protein